MVSRCAGRVLRRGGMGRNPLSQLSLAAVGEGMAAWEEGSMETREEICSSAGRRCLQLGLGGGGGVEMESSSRLSLCFGGELMGWMWGEGEREGSTVTQR